jgi:hypothetical protein
VKTTTGEGDFKADGEGKFGIALTVASARVRKGGEAPTPRPLIAVSIGPAVLTLGMIRFVLVRV